jgi:DNA polymerase
MKIKKKKRLIKLEKLKSSWINCKRCDLKKQRNNVVLWRGNPCAKIFLVGEAPGETEDLKGKPFVGKSGKVLNSMLKECGLNIKKDIFVSNVLGCRPPNNAKPEPKQVRKCRPKLERLIEIVKPNMIVLLGGSAALHLAGITTISHWKGKPTTIEVDNVVYGSIVTYHPSYYLRRGKNKKLRAEIISHLEKAVRISNE